MGEPLAFDSTDEVLARAAWSRVAEPGDEMAAALIGQLGAGEALRWVAEAARGGQPVPGTGRSGVDRAGFDAGLLVRDQAREDDDRAVGTTDASGGPVPCREVPVPDRSSAARLRRAVGRWAPRLAGLDPRRELSVLSRCGGTLLVPGRPGWPAPLDDLGLAAPTCLWVRGDLDLAGAARRSVAVVGARACTEYGTRTAEDLAVGLADRHFAVVSGGAYGIDAAAHRGALAAPGPTLAFLAGGIDRFYPAGNASLLEEIVESGGAVVAEVPPGSAPSRVRFLLRNRLIAAFAGATVVVEAAWRSGALSTAARAAELLRPVGAVPGPVTSTASAGCHRLLRESDAVCVTDAAEAAELAGGAGDAVPARETPRAGIDLVDAVGRRLWDALPVRASASAESVARTAGLAVDETIGGLGHLELAGLARRVGGGWRRG